MADAAAIGGKSAVEFAYPPPTSETWSETSSFEFDKAAKRRGQ